MTKGKLVAYWITTALTAFVFLSGGVMDALRGPAVAEGMKHLGYPLYFAAILGVWKFLGGLAILAPRLPRLKEWAYAGMFFDLSGAAVSHASSGDSFGKVITPLVLLGLAMASWALRPETRTLGASNVRRLGDALQSREPRPLSAPAGSAG